MTKLQEYLEKKYPSNREKIIKITTSDATELLEGGELDLSAFTNLEEVEIDLNFLTTPLTNVKNLATNFKNLDFIEDKTQLTDEEKKLFEDLGIKDKTVQNINQQKVVKEIKRLSEEFSISQLANKKINLHFASPKLPQTKLDNKESISEEDNGEWNIYLNIERKDKNSNFSPSLLFWTFTKELTAIKHGNYDKDPLFWNNSVTILKWTLDNIEKIYQKDLEKLTNPANFPHSQLEISDFLTIYFPKLEDGDKLTTSQTVIKSEIVNKSWKNISEELITLTSQEFNKATTDDEKAKLWLKLVLEYNNSQEYTIKANYHEESPLIKKIGELITGTPLKLQLESLEQKQAQLPTLEEIEKLTKQKQLLENYLKDALDADEYQRIIDQINRIN